MRIAIIGAQCTGKSTLLDKVKESGILSPGYIFCEEVVRKLVKEKQILINKEGDFESQKAIFYAHLDNARENIDMVTDRSCIDAWVYTLYNREQFNVAELNELNFLFVHTLAFYDKIFYLPVEFELESDGFRSLDKEFQAAIDEKFRYILNMYNIQYNRLSGSIENRFQLFKKHIL